MACGAVLIGHVGTVSHCERHVCGMAHRAVLVDHVRCMGLVAFQTFRDFLVGFMARGTEQLRMEARMIFRLFALLRVAREAGVSEVWREFHLEGRMRVRMAGVATADLIMGFAGVA